MQELKGQLEKEQETGRKFAGDVETGVAGMSCLAPASRCVPMLKLSHST